MLEGVAVNLTLHYQLNSWGLAHDDIWQSTSGPLVVVIVLDKRFELAVYQSCGQGEVRELEELIRFFYMLITKR